MRNLLTDVAGVLVGNAQDARAATGVTVAVFEQSSVASVATLGGAPGSRATSLLEPEMTRGLIDAIVLSGGSLYGLDAAGGVSAVLCAQGKGAQFGGLTLPVAVQAILFDLTNGGEKDWLTQPLQQRPPYWDHGRDAALAAAQDFALGTAGAGFGATTVTLKGGLGSASAHTRQGFTVGALVAVNAVGSATIGEGPHFWAGAYEQAGEFGGRGWPHHIPPEALAMRFKGQPLPATATTIGMVVTDAAELAIADATRSRALPGRPTAVPVAPAGPVAELVWHGTVDQAVGVALAPGAACTFEGVFARVGDSVAPRALTVQCGGQVLYRSGADVSAADFALREGPIFGAATHEYTLRYHDERDGQSARVAVSTHTHTATVWREGDAALRVTIFVRETSDPREGEALGGRGPTRGPSFAGAIEQAVRVTAVRGHAPVAAGARCTFAVRPVWEYPENCRMVVRCGETWLYGARESGYLTCEVQGGRPVAALDENTTDHGGDPRVTWRGRRVQVSDFTESGDWAVDLAR